jgi:hypothetical protein
MSTNPTSGSVIADRFELLEEMSRVTDGRLFLARDIAFGEAVAVKLLGTGCGMDVTGRQTLEQAVRRVQITPHAHLLRHDSLDSSAGVHVREWVHGFSLLDLLRRRRELSADDTFRLLATLPATLDYLTHHEIPVPHPLLGKVFIQFARNVEPEKVATQAIAEWPPFAVKINALSVRALLSDTTSDTTRTMIVDLRNSPANEPVSAPRALAELLYELLGGRQRDADGRRYSPLSALHEEGNGVLRRALLVAPHADCTALWVDLRKAQGTNVPSGLHLAIKRPEPPPLTLCSHVPPTPAPGLAAILTPKNPGIPAIHLIARPHFTIGRSLQSADFITRFLPESAANNVLTDRLSRVHVVAENVGGKILLRDGNGSSPSVNGSTLDSHLLSPDHPTALHHRAILSLGHEYFMELLPLLQPLARTWPEAKLENWPGGDAPQREPQGAVLCEPRHGQPIIRRAIWLFSEIGFGVDYGGRLIWDTRVGGDSPAALHHYRGCFWVRNRALVESVLQINGTPLDPEQVAPLASGQVLRLGGQDYAVEIQ